MRDKLQNFPKNGNLIKDSDELNKTMISTSQKWESRKQKKMKKKESESGASRGTKHTCILGRQAVRKNWKLKLGALVAVFQEQPWALGLFRTPVPTRTAWPTGRLRLERRGLTGNETLGSQGWGLIRSLLWDPGVYMLSSWFWYTLAMGHTPGNTDTVKTHLLTIKRKTCYKRKQKHFLWVTRWISRSLQGLNLGPTPTGAHPSLWPLLLWAPQAHKPLGW